MPETTTYEHVVLNKDGTPMIENTTMKVIELLLEKKAYGWSPEELHLQHPHLTLGQVHSALAYYWDHRKKLDEDIEQRLEAVNKIQNDTEPSPLIKRLKNKNLI